MGQYNIEPTDFVTKTRTFLSTWIGVIVAIVSITVVFVLTSLEGTKEVKASNRDSAELIAIFREENIDKLFPEEKVDVFQFKNKEYYFVVDKYNDENIPEKWYFAYDGGFEYVLGDYKFWVLTLLVIGVALYVAKINYVSTSRQTMEKDSFKATLAYYSEKKKINEKDTQYLPDFCEYKNKQLYEMAKRNIIEQANINYKFYNSPDFNFDVLEPFQKRKLEEIKHIKIERITASDLLQENDKKKGIIRTVLKLGETHSLLPDGQTTLLRKFMLRGAVQKIFSSVMSGFVITFGVKLGNWGTGLAYGLVILMSYAGAVITAVDQTNVVLRNRFIGKADLLNEFYNIKEMFYEKKGVAQVNEQDTADKTNEQFGGRTRTDYIEQFNT